MKLNEIKKESKILYQEIDECITELLKARSSHDTEAEGKALFRMEGLMVGTQQHLSCIMETEDIPSDTDEAVEKEFNDVWDSDLSGQCDTAVAKKVARHFYGLGASHSIQLPSSFEEARDKANFEEPHSLNAYIAFEEAFKKGAEWMALQGVKARCLESFNPVSESPDERPHVVTLLYEENENTPYVVGGDEVEIIIRKRQ